MFRCLRFYRIPVLLLMFAPLTFSSGHERLVRMTQANFYAYGTQLVRYQNSGDASVGQTLQQSQDALTVEIYTAPEIDETVKKLTADHDGIQTQVDQLRADVKRLSDINDALTNRMNAMADELSALKTTSKVQPLPSGAATR